jgi:tRNA threonylcarbamoyladenosine biosynthesis protein TsaE
MVILDEHMLDFISHSPEQTVRFGARLGGLLRPGDVLCLEGNLGSGKTCLVQGIGQGMGISEPITSPTFTLVSEHRASGRSPLVLYHIDLYRLTLPAKEAWAFGLEEYLDADGVCVIEWADRAPAVLPSQHLWITLRYLDDSKRNILIKATGTHYDQVLLKFRERAFGF